MCEAQSSGIWIVLLWIESISSSFCVQFPNVLLKKGGNKSHKSRFLLLWNFDALTYIKRESWSNKTCNLVFDRKASLGCIRQPTGVRKIWITKGFLTCQKKYCEKNFKWRNGQNTRLKGSRICPWLCASMFWIYLHFRFNIFFHFWVILGSNFTLIVVKTRIIHLQLEFVIQLKFCLHCVKLLMILSKKIWDALLSSAQMFW